MKNNINRPSKGMVTDLDPLDQPKESYRYALNSVGETREGDRNIISNERSNEACWELPEGYLPIGKIYTKDNTLVIFSTNGTSSEIGTVRNCDYNTVINSDCLNFSIEHQIEAVYRVRRGCETVIYWTDNFNPVRTVNINKLDNYYSDAYEAYLDNPAGEFSGEQWDCSSFALIPPYEIPCFASAEILTTGQIEAGSYNFAIQLLDADLNPTPWIITSHPVNIYHDDVNEAYETTNGSSNLESDNLGGLTTVTNKSIKLNLSSLDQRFVYYRIAVTQATSFNGQTVRTIVSPEINIEQDTFIFDGNLNGYVQIATDELKPGRTDLEYAGHIEQLENRLLLGNVKGKQVNFCNFQSFASSIHSRYVIKEVDANDQEALGNPKNPLTPFECMGFMGGEVYAMGIVYIFDDGFESPVYHIPGPSPNQRWNWTTEVCDVVDDNSVIATWTSDIEHLVPASDAAAYNALPSNQKIQKWRVEETAIKVSATEGQMAYWQSQSSNYPDIKFCDSGDYWGIDICGNNLVDTPIRHHRFPSRTLEPHVDNSGVITEYSTLTFDVSLKEGQSFPAVPSVTITIDYDYNAVPQPTYSLTIFPGDLPIVNELVDRVIGDVTSITNVVIGGTITTYTTEFDYSTSIQASSSTYVDSSTLRLLGVKFSNVTYPHPDIVGHYFVRADRDSFNRTILDAGIAGRAREDSYAFDYITFSYFTEGNNSTDHHYMFTPKFQYTRDALVPQYIKTELEFDFDSKNLGVEDYDGVGGFIKEVDTLIEHRVQNYIGTVTTNGDTNHSKETLLTSDALSYDDNYQVGNRQYNLSHTNRVQMIKLGSSLPKNNNDIPYVTLRVERDVHSNLDSIKYYKMHNCSYSGDVRAEIYGGDVYIAPYQIANSLLREYFQSAYGAILTAVIIVGAVLGTLATAGAGAGLFAAGAAALGVSVQAAAVATGIAIAAVAAGAIGVTAVTIRAIFEAYEETDLDKMAEDSELDGLKVKGTSFIAYANELLVGCYVESEINTALRQPITNECGEFYQHVGKVNDYFRDKIMYFNQEDEKWLAKGVICPESYHYNLDFSREDREKTYFPLPKIYDCCSDCLEKHPTRIHYSEQSFQEELSDNYRVFLPNNYRDVEAEHGELTGLIRKSNNLFVFTEESLWQLPQNVQQGIVNEIVTFLGTGDFFSIPPRKPLDSDEGAAGTVHKWSIIKTPFGIVYFSQREKSIYLLGGESGIQKLSDLGLSNWFFEYSKDYLAEQFEEITSIEFPNADNNANPDGVGFHTVYDPRHKRILFTKRDYTILPAYTNNIITSTVDGGVPTETLVDGEIFYDTTNNKFGIATGTSTFTYISLDDPDYFQNRSLTISFSLLSKTWKSFHSYLPLFYYNDQNTFFSSIDNSVWRHNAIGSYQTFYGTLYDHIIEYVSVSNPISTRLWEDIVLQTHAKKYSVVDDEYYDERFVTFNYLTLYNRRQISGELEMIVKDTQANPENYYSQQIVNTNNSVLIDRNERNFSVNDFRDMRIDYDNPMWTKGWVSVQTNYPIDKVVNTSTIDINKDWFQQESFRDKYLIIRLRFANFDDVELTTDFTIETEQDSPR